jgi:hypothetical protein
LSSELAQRGLSRRKDHRAVPPYKMLLGQCIQSTALKQVGRKAMACRETRERTPDAWLVKKSSELATMPDAYKSASTEQIWANPQNLLLQKSSTTPRTQKRNASEPRRKRCSLPLIESDRHRLANGANAETRYNNSLNPASAFPPSTNG